MNTNSDKSPQVGSGSALPLFYRAPAILRSDLHGKYGLDGSNNYAFSAETAAIPIGIGEFAAASIDYPIVFSSGENPMPLAVVGIRHANLMLEDDGTWQAGRYIPAYVRRYPFILVDTDNPDEHLLAADTDFPGFVDTGKIQGERLFNDQGGASETAKAAMAFCRAYHEDHLRTKRFMEALRSEGLLTPQRADFKVTGQDPLALDEFLGIDRDRCRSLAKTKVGKWWTEGWLDLVISHWNSYRNWQRLVDLHSARSKDVQH